MSKTIHLSVPDFFRNYCNLLLDSIRDLISRLEVERPSERQESILKWIEEMKTLIKYTSKILSFVRHPGTLQQIRRLLEEMVQKSMAYQNKVFEEMALFPLRVQSLRMLPLPFEEAMELMARKTYSHLPLCIGEEVVLQQKAKDPEGAGNFSQEFVLRQKVSRDDTIARVNEIIRKKIALLPKNFPFEVNSIKINRGKLIITVANIVRLTFGVCYFRDKKKWEFFAHAAESLIPGIEPRSNIWIEEMNTILTQNTENSETLVLVIKRFKEMFASDIIASICDSLEGAGLQQQMSDNIFVKRFLMAACFKKVGGIMVQIPAYLGAILGPIAIELRASESPSNLLEARYSVLVVNSTSLEKAGTLEEGFLLTKKTNMLSIPNERLFDPLAIIYYITQPIRRTRLLAVSALIERVFVSLPRFRFPSIGVSINKLQTISINFREAILIAALSVESKGTIQISRTECYFLSSEDFFSLCSNIMQMNTDCFFKLLNSLIVQTVLQKEVCSYFIDSRFSFYFTIFYRLGILLQARTIPEDKKPGVKCISNSIKNLRKWDKMKARKLKTQYDQFLCKKGRIYLHLRRYQFFSIRERNRYVVMILEIANNSDLKIYIKVYKVIPNDVSLYVKAGEKIEEWILPGFTRMDNKQIEQKLTEVGRAVEESIAIMELYSHLLLEAKYDHGKIIHKSISSIRCLQYFENYNFSLTTNELEIKSNTDFLPYYSEGLPTKTLALYDPDNHWMFIREDKRFIIKPLKKTNNLHQDIDSKFLKETWGTTILLQRELEKTLENGSLLLLFQPFYFNPIFVLINVFRRTKSGAPTEKKILSVKYFPLNEKLKFFPSLVIKDNLCHLLKKQFKTPGSSQNIFDILDRVAGFFLELSHVLKGRVIYSSVSHLILCPHTLVRDSDKIEIFYKQYSLLIKVVDFNVIQIFDTYFMKKEGRSIPHFGCLGFLLAQFVDGRALGEIDPEFSNLIEIKKYQNINRETLKVNQPKTKEKYFELHYHKQKYLQEIFMKLFDYLKCFCIFEHDFSSESHHKEKFRRQFGKRILSIQYLKHVYVRTPLPTSSKKLQDTLYNTNSFCLHMACSESDLISAQFNQEIRNLTIEGIIYFLKIVFFYEPILLLLLRTIQIFHQNFSNKLFTVFYKDASCSASRNQTLIIPCNISIRPTNSVNKDNFTSVKIKLCIDAKTPFPDTYIDAFVETTAEKLLNERDRKFILKDDALLIRLTELERYVVERASI